MFAEELVKIKESETYAEELQKSAKAEAEAIVAEAEAAAQQLMTDCHISAKEKVDCLLSEGQQIAQKQYDDAIAETTELCAKLAEAAETRKPEMVKMIVERVKSSVNM